MSAAKKILLADDDTGILDSVAMILEFEGFEVETTVNGETLINRAVMPDLILLDIWMSGVDGREICRELKKNSATAATPVILLSASRDIERSAIESGADGFLAKPFELDDLVRIINKHLG